MFEATGAYHRQLEAALGAGGIPFAKVNPRQARRFAEATGRLAKTDRVREIVLMAEGFVPQFGSTVPALTGPAADLAASLVDLLLAVERLVRYRETALPPPAALHILLRDRGPRLGSVEGRPGPEAHAHSSGVALQLLEGVRRARGRINLALGPAPSRAFAAGGPVPAAQQAALGSPRGGVPAALNRPIQVTLACGLTLGLGLALSPTRWYWAVVTAYIVFNNTRTRADTAVRALSRSAGTLGGVLAGTLIATTTNLPSVWQRSWSPSASNGTRRPQLNSIGDRSDLIVEDDKVLVWTPPQFTLSQFKC